MATTSSRAAIRTSTEPSESAVTPVETGFQTNSTRRPIRAAYDALQQRCRPFMITGEDAMTTSIEARQRRHLAAVMPPGFGGTR